MTGRWSAAFDVTTALTIAGTESVVDLRQDGGSRIFALVDGNRNGLFRVIDNGGALNGNGSGSR